MKPKKQPYKKSRKSQMKMLETIAVLLVLFILIAIGSIFYFKLQSSSVKETTKERAKQHAIEIAQSAMFLTEIQCTNNNVAVSNCVDWYKADALKTAIELDPNLKNNYYFELFKYSNITVYQIYPVETNPLKSSVVAYDFQPPNLKSEEAFRVPVLIYNPDYRSEKNVFAFGYLEVIVYT